MALAKVDCTCERCGRKFEHRHKCYNRSAADDYQKWAEQAVTICPECWYKQKQEEEAKKAAEETARMQLPELVGSEKQVAWAQKIRMEMILENRYTKAIKDGLVTLETFCGEVDKAKTLIRNGHCWITDSYLTIQESPLDLEVLQDRKGNTRTWNGNEKWTTLPMPYGIDMESYTEMKRLANCTA